MVKTMLTSSTRFSRSIGNKVLRTMLLRREPQERRQLQKSELRERVGQLVIVLQHDTHRMFFSSAKEEARDTSRRRR